MVIKEKYIKNIKQTSINITNSNIDSVRFKNDTKTSIRIYKDNLIGVAGAIGKYDEVNLEKEAVNALSKNIEYTCSPSCNRNEKLDKRSDFIKESDVVDEVDELLYELRKKHPDFIFSNKVNLTETNTSISNENNLKLQYGDKNINVGLLFKHKESSSLFEGFIGSEERKYDRNILLKDADLILNAFNNKVDLPGNKKYPVAFFSSMIPVTKFASDLDGKIFASGSSLFSDKMNKKIFSEDFTLYQSFNPEDVMNVPFFDAEGVVNNEFKYALIENGVLKAPYTDKKTSAKFNLPLTGSASSAYDGVPAERFISCSIKKSQKSLKELFAGDMGIVTFIAEGGDFTTKGDFGTPVQLAFLFDGEKLIGRLPDIQYSSNIYDMFGSGFRGASKDSFLDFCSDKFAVMDLNVSKI